MLGWDLHIHPGSAAEGRWGNGAEIQQAAARAGVKGFVWKSHAGSSADDVASLQDHPCRAIASLVLNSPVGPADVERALAQGVRWIWAPSRAPDGALAWELPLPSQWETIVAVLHDCDEPLVIATSHVDVAGRAAIAGLCEGSSTLLCSVTHSLYLDDDEVRHLASTGAVFEADLFTRANPVRDWPLAELTARTDLVNDLDAVIYLASDAGQVATGDPYVFVAEEVEKVAAQRPDQIECLALTGPDFMAGHIGHVGRATRGQR